MSYHFPNLIFLLLSRFVHCPIISIRQILTEQENGEGREGLKETRDEESDPPSRELSGSHLPDHREHERHDQLRRASSEVSPPGGDTISRAHDRSGEHRAHPELRRDKSREREPREEPDHDKPYRRLDPRREVHGGSGGECQRGGGEARAEEVAGRAHDETSEDGAGHGGDTGVSDVGGGEVEVLADDREERRSREGGDEAAEELEPREVESSHVRLSDGEEAERCRLVLGVHRKCEPPSGGGSRFFSFAFDVHCL